MEVLANCTKCYKINTYISSEFSLIQDSLQEYFNTKVLGNFGHSQAPFLNMKIYVWVCLYLTASKFDYDQHYKRKRTVLLNPHNRFIIDLQAFYTTGVLELLSILYTLDAVFRFTR